MGNDALFGGATEALLPGMRYASPASENPESPPDSPQLSPQPAPTGSVQLLITCGAERAAQGLWARPLPEAAG
jgi:hypothetical protein